MIAPLKYLRIRSECGRLIALRGVILAVLVALIFMSLLHQVDELNLYGDGGLIDRIGEFISTLTGFYVAALVAVATFSQGSPEMDEGMVSGKLHVKIEGGNEELSRREYLTALFGYLVTLAFALSLTSIIFVVIGGAFDKISGSLQVNGLNFSYHYVVSFATSALYFALLFHLIVETSSGLYYFIDKLYRVKPRIKPGSLKSDPSKK